MTNAGDKKQKIFMENETSNGGEYPEKLREGERDFTKKKEYRTYFLLSVRMIVIVFDCLPSSVGGEGFLKRFIV
ncbi:hypothetical protein ACLOJK_011600 [Asimina triloba]